MKRFVDDCSVIQHLLLNLSFLQRIEHGLQYTNLQSDFVQITVFLEKAYYINIFIWSPWGEVVPGGPAPLGPSPAGRLSPRPRTYWDKITLQPRQTGNRTGQPGDNILAKSSNFPLCFQWIYTFYKIYLLIRLGKSRTMGGHISYGYAFYNIYWLIYFREK